MSLENVKESVTLTGESKFDDTVVVQFTAQIPSNGIAGSVNTQIRDIDRYNTNRTQIRRDQADFQNEVWDVEDRLSNQEKADEEDEATE